MVAWRQRMILNGDPHARSILPVVFLHIQKTAGSVVRLLLHSHFDRSELAPLYNFDQYDHAGRIADAAALHRLFTGHMDRDALDAIEAAAGRARKFTFLRDPVSHVVSQAAFARMSLDDFMRQPTAFNQQAQLLSGLSRAADARHAQKAIACMDVFGLFEDMRGSLDLISHSLRLPYMELPESRLNASGADHSVPPEVSAEILARSPQDRALYDYARMEFSRRLTAAFGTLQSPQQRRDKLNAAYREAVFRRLRPCFGVELRAENSWPGLNWGLRESNRHGQAWRTLQGRASIFCKLIPGRQYIVSLRVHSARDEEAMQALCVAANDSPLAVAGHGLEDGIPVLNWLLPGVPANGAVEIGFEGELQVSAIRVYHWNPSGS
jgi:hypothetical protein